jgi:hypothetical protein
MNLKGRMYLDLLKRTLSGAVYKDPSIPTAWRPESIYDAKRRQTGRDWPLHAHTMIGLDRLENLQYCIEQVIEDDIPGDLIETGVWRGGACIFMRGVLRAYGVYDRTIWVADSFCGFPTDQERDDDAALVNQPDQSYLSVPMSEVINNFEAYGLLNFQIRFLPGWFDETLPGPIKRLSILRLDGDLYSSTMSVLSALYPLLEPGGFCIVDDWNVIMCRTAVRDYRADHSISDEIINIDGRSVYWRKGEIKEEFHSS